MSKYLNIVANLAQDLNSGYKGAKEDLFGIVDEMTVGLRSILSDSKIDIIVRSDGPEGTYFGISVDLAPKDESVKNVGLGTYFIPSTGYPISTGIYRGPLHYDASEFFGDRDALDSNFQKFFDGPGSHLVQAIGFALRRLESDDDIPF